MNRKEILDIINGTLSGEQDTVEVFEENFLHDSNLDSLGYAIFWITLNKELADTLKTNNQIIEKEYIEELNMTNYKVSELIDYIIDRIEKA